MKYPKQLYRRRPFTILAIGSAASLLTAVALAAYPDKPVRMVVTFPPGGTTDILVRFIADKLTKKSGQPFIVENRAGAGGNIGMEYVARSPADGYTIGSCITSHAISMSLPDKPKYDVEGDLSPVSLLSMSMNVLVVSNNISASNISELVALSKSRPLTFASSGNGTTPHLSGELLKRMTGANMTHIPYKGAAQAIADVMGGTVDMMFDAVTTAEPQIRAGKVRAIGVTGQERSESLPAVPPIADSVPGYAIYGWNGLCAPAGTPQQSIAWLNSSISEILKTDEWKAKIASQGISHRDISVSEFKAFISSEVQKWRSIVAKIGVMQ